MLGYEFDSNRFDHEFIKPSHREMDVTNISQIESILKKYQPDAVINAAAIINIDKCEEEKGFCFGVNRDGVKNILEAIKSTGLKNVKFIQVSSSEVFGRLKEGEYEIEGYSEEDEPRPVTNYQKSKYDAEKILEKFAENNPSLIGGSYIARAGWLYGKGRRSFVDFMYEDLQREEEVIIASDQWRSPTSAEFFASSVISLLDDSRENGIYHIVDEVKSGEATPKDVVEEIQRFLNESAKAKIKEVYRKDIFKTPRAPSNVLKNTKLQSQYWRESLRQYLNSIKI